MTQQSKAIVDALLEAEPDEHIEDSPQAQGISYRDRPLGAPPLGDADLDAPESNLERYAQAMGQEHEKDERRILDQFKRGAREYIKWAHTDEEEGRLYDPADLLALRRAKTFAEAEAILAQYESEPSFLYMIGQGYFV